jgi:hypothetical protein
MAVLLESLRARRKLFIFIGVALLVIFLSQHYLVSSFELLQKVPGTSLSTPETLVDVCDHDPPANWDKLYKWEDNLPQHDVDLPFPEGKDGRYVLFSNQIQMLGWNNLLNEMCAFLFYSTKINLTAI